MRGSSVEGVSATSQSKRVVARFTHAEANYGAGTTIHHRAGQNLCKRVAPSEPQREGSLELAQTQLGMLRKNSQMKLLQE